MSEEKQLLLCTYYWPPSGGAGVQRSLKFAKFLPEFAVIPTVLTVAEDSATYPITDFSLNSEVSEALTIIRTKSKEPFNTYSKLSGKKEVPRSGFANSDKSGFLEKLMRFIRGNFFLPDARRGWNKYAIEAASKLIENNKIDVILTTSPPHSSQLIGLKLKEKYGLPWIADLRDPWTDIYYYKDMYPTWLAKKIDSRYERRVLENADKVIVTSENTKHLFLQKSKKIRPKDIVILPNGFDLEDFPVIIPSNKAFTISYTGTISETYDIETFADACKSVIYNNNLKIKIQFIGQFSSSIRQTMERAEISNFCEFIPPVNHTNSIEFLLRSDSLLLLIPNTKNNQGIIPGKLFEYLGAKKPIIGIGPQEGDAAKIIANCNAGKMIQFGDVEELSNYLNQLYEKWENNRLPLSNQNVEKYSRKTLAGLLANEILSLT